MPNTKEKGKLIEVLSKHIPYGHATLCLIAEELMAEGVTFATDNNVAYKMKATDKDTNVPSNGDRIRAMTDEELGKFMCSRLDCYGSDCPGKHLCHHGSNGLVEWMKQPAEVE